MASDHQMRSFPFTFSRRSIWPLPILLLFLSFVSTPIQANNEDLHSLFNLPASDSQIEGSGYYRNSPAISNLTAIVGETVQFNCSLAGFVSDHGRHPSFLTTSSSAASIASLMSPNQVLKQSAQASPFNSFDFKLNPTWLKADPIYNQYGIMVGYKTENIIVTRKGIIAENLRDKMKLVSESEEKLQILRISNVNIRNEGKYICREFNSQFDRLFYLNVFSSVSGLSIKFNSNSKYFRAVYTGTSNFLGDETASISNNDLNSNAVSKGINFQNSLTSSISIKENDELTVNCTVSSSKPAANISIWIMPNHRASNDEESRKLEITDFQTFRNKDLTLRSVAIAKFMVNRLDNHKSITCMAENVALDEKWESKRVINVLFSPRCSKYQKQIYHTGINQTVELECRMSDANPPYLDFAWNFMNNQGNKEKIRSNGFVSRISWMPRSEHDFGEVSCSATNGLEDGECKMQLVLGGPPNPPVDCYHKENNKTIIIECKPGFDQGDPEVYYYLLKKKTNGVLVEYARKRDSCSFLISNMILEEHLNEFFIYSSNKYGNNKETATRLVIENKELLHKNSNKLQDLASQSGRRFTFILGFGSLCVFIFVFICCLFMKCRNTSIAGGSSINNKLPYHNHHNYNYEHNSSIGSHYHYSNGTLTKEKEGKDSFSSGKNHIHYQEPYKYQLHYNSKSSIHMLNDPQYFHEESLKQLEAEEKSNYMNANSSSTTSTDYDPDDLSNPLYDTKKKAVIYGKVTKITRKPNNNSSVRSPSLLNNIQDLEMSPRSKKRSIERMKPISSSYGNNSLVDETTETESENYTDSNESKQRKSNEFSDTTSVDQKLDYDNPLHTFTQTTSLAIAATLASSQANQNKLDYDSSAVQLQNYSLSAKSLPKVNIWYGSPSTGIFGDDEYSTDNNHLTYNGTSDRSGFGNDQRHHHDKKVARYDYRSFVSTSNPKSVTTQDAIQNGYHRKTSSESKNRNDFDDYPGNSVTVDDDDDYRPSQESRANKYDWPYSQNGAGTTGNNSFKVGNNSNNNNNNNETISLDVDDEKMIGILV